METLICKPHVKYNLDEMCIIVEGQGAMVHPIDHPSLRVSNESVVWTSKVINVSENEFETENTIYKGVHLDEIHE